MGSFASPPIGGYLEMMAVTPDFVVEFVDRLKAAIERESLARLSSSALRALQLANGNETPAEPRRRRRRAIVARRSRTVTVSKGRRLQGQYIGRLRNLKGRNRLRVKAVARKKGVEAAIKLADKLAR
jgi:hypothetical protein